MNRTECRPGRIAWTGLFLLAASTALAAPPFELKDGDRVVFLGGTFIEREQSYGYLETLLTSRFPDRNITFRNLGWSGDTVWGEARSRFGPPAEGFAHLKAHVDDLKPTVIFVNYGLNESFAGKAGLPEFEKGLNTLLDVLDRTGARIVMITPRKLENLGPPLPDPTRTNELLGDYVAVLKRVGAARKYRIVDFFEEWPFTPTHPETDNGLHLLQSGYETAAYGILNSLGLAIESIHFQLRVDRIPTDLERPGSNPSPRVDLIRKSSREITFRSTLACLTSGFQSSIVVEGLDRGTYQLKIDGKPISKPIPIPVDRPIQFNMDGGPDTAQAEKLRQAIIAKNELYFYRWRPQNETYLFGFRKHEQGNNAVEIPKFDPLVAAKEAEIARLRVPVPHTYEIFRTGEGR